MLRSLLLLLVSAAAVVAAVEPSCARPAPLYSNTSNVARWIETKRTPVVDEDFVRRVEKSLDGKEDVIVNEPAPLTIRTEVRRMESVYLYLAVIVCVAVVNALIIDFAFGGPIFGEEETVLPPVAHTPTAVPASPLRASKLPLSENRIVRFTVKDESDAEC